MGEDRISGRVKWFDPDRGYGFIQRQDGLGDVYVNIQEVRQAGLSDLAEGQAVTFTIAVTNSGGITLTGVIVSDTVAPACDAVIGILSSGQVTTYTCSLVVSADVTNTAAVTGTSPAGTTVTDTDDAVVTVITPSITIAKTPDTQMAVSGATVTFTIAITNTGDADLTGVTVSDPSAPDCDYGPDDLSTGQSVSYACSFDPVTVDFVNTAVVTGTPPAKVMKLG